MILVEWSEVATVPTAAFSTAAHSTTTLNKGWARHRRGLLVGVGFRAFLFRLFVLLGGRELVSRMSLEVVVLLDGGRLLGQGSCVRLIDGGEQALDHGTGVLVFGGVVRVSWIGVARTAVGSGPQPLGRDNAQLAVVGEDLGGVPSQWECPRSPCQLRR